MAVTLALTNEERPLLSDACSGVYAKEVTKADEGQELEIVDIEMSIETISSALRDGIL